MLCKRFHAKLGLLLRRSGREGSLTYELSAAGPVWEPAPRWEHVGRRTSRAGSPGGAPVHPSTGWVVSAPVPEMMSALSALRSGSLRRSLRVGHLRGSTGRDPTDADLHGPDPLLVEQVPETLRSCAPDRPVAPLGAMCQRRIRRLITPALSACEELLAGTDRISPTEDPATILAHYDAATAFLVDLGDQAARLRSELGLPEPDRGPGS